MNVLVHRTHEGSRHAAAASPNPPCRINEHLWLGYALAPNNLTCWFCLHLGSTLVASIRGPTPVLIHVQMST